MTQVQGRGAAGNPPNRFERLRYEPDPEAEPDDGPGPATVLLADVSRTAITFNDSPDIGFDASLNPYRGCEHGCAYCYARPTHEYLGFSPGLDFETRIVVKERAPELLRAELSSPRWKPQVIVMSGVTDCYQPVERRLRLTRRCLEVLAEFRNPVGIVTKNDLVTRDVDVLEELARQGAATVFLSITTLDVGLSRDLEPRASTPANRLAALRALSAAGIPCGVMTAPVIPGLNDHEIPAILAAAHDAGARRAGYVPLRLPHAVLPLFTDWLERHRPLRKDKVLSLVRSMRGGRMNDPSFGSRMRGEGAIAAQIESLFTVSCRRLGLETHGARTPSLSTAAFRRPWEQLALW